GRPTDRGTLETGVDLEPAGAHQPAVRSRHPSLDQRCSDASGGTRGEPRAHRRRAGRRPAREHEQRAHGGLRRACGDGASYRSCRSGRSYRRGAFVRPQWWLHRRRSHRRSGESRVTLWSGRFDTAPDPAAFDFGVSFGFDRALFEDDVTGSIAWAEALAAAEVLSNADATAIVNALREILEQGRRDPAWVSGPDEDVHSFVERQLVDRVGDAGRRLHTGRSRNEQVSLDLRLYMRRRISLLQQAVVKVVGACADQAEQAGAAMMPSYTHLRRAQPVLVAHFFLSHAAALRRDYARLVTAAT